MYLKKQNVTVENILREVYITDDLETALKLQDAGEAVLIYLHPGNSGQDFSRFLYAVEEPEELDEVYLERIWRRVKGLPWEILQTERCLIRESCVEDVESFYRIYSAPSVTEYMEDLYPEKEQEEQYIRDYIENVYAFFEYGVWTIVEKESGEIIGRAGLSRRKGYEEVELGFVIGEPWQRKGYAFEVCSAILKYGAKQLEFAKIQAFVEAGNTASLGLCAKLGMEPVGTAVEDNKEYVRLMWKRAAVL